MPLSLITRKPRSKYNARKTVVDGKTFDSRAEATEYGRLRLREQLGEIRDLRCQVRYPLLVNGQKICAYVADFVYTETATGKEVVQDTKGVLTPEFRLKSKLMKAVYGIEIKLTT